MSYRAAKISIVIAAFATVFVPKIARADSATWDGNAASLTDGLWSNVANWGGVTTVPGTNLGETATFNNAGGGFTTIDLGAGVTVNTVLFDTANAAAYTIGSGAVGSQTFTLNNAGAVTMNSTVANNELFNSAILLGTDGTAQTFTFTNNSTAKLLTFAGGITGSTGAGLKTLAVAGAGNFAISGIIGNGTTGTVALTKSGAGTLTLSGNNAYTGTTTVNGGTLILSGNNTSVTGATAISAGTLQLQANSGNTAGFTAASTALGVNNITTFNSGTTLQLRSDSSVTFTGGNNMGGLGNANVTIDVNQLTGAGSNNTITFAPGGFNVFRTTLNVTGGNGYTLALGPITDVGSGTATNPDVFNPTTANLSINGINLTSASNGTVGLGGTSTGNSVTGVIHNTTGTLSVTKLNSSTWTLTAANTYTGATTVNGGTLLLDMTTGSLASTTALTLGGGNFTVKGLAGGTSADHGYPHSDGWDWQQQDRH